jgi:hypothetical protein
MICGTFLCFLLVPGICVERKLPVKALKRTAADSLLELQKQTLDAVLAEADTQRQLLEVEKERLVVEREKLAMKKIKLMTKGVFQDESGNWVWVGKSKEE